MPFADKALSTDRESLCLTAHHRRVIDYFTQTRNDYRWLWGTRRHLGLHCGFHDDQHRRHDDAVMHMNRVLASLAGIERHERVLDAGCGIGGSAIWLAKHIGCEVVGVNIHAGQVAEAQQLAHLYGVNHEVRFYLADFSSTQLPEDSFDVVWAIESVCYAEDKQGFFREAYRLLRPGGRLVIADAFLACESLSDDGREIVDRWRQGWVIPNVVGKTCFRDWLEETGFHNVRFVDITAQVAPSSRRIYLAGLMFYPIALLLHWLGLRSGMQHGGIVSGLYQYKARRRGLGVYGIFLAEK
jgi:cyclopropane fatty-acyl-phospholipid synthase-like methyltransferase